jgi:hypothetical protein
MRTAIKIFIALISLLILYSCKTTQSKKETKEKYRLSDTVKPAIDYTLKTICSSQFTGYFRFNGFLISNYYLICDHATNNGDSICIITPKVLTPEASSCRDDKKIITNGRILLVVFRNEKYLFRNVIDNYISIDCGGGLVKLLDNGFIIENSVGQGYVFDYHINVIYLDKTFYVSKINMYAWRPSLGTSKDALKEFQDKELKLAEFKLTLIDSLRKQFDL